MSPAPTLQHRNTATPKHRNTETPQHRNTATPKHRNTATLPCPPHFRSSFLDAFRALYYDNQVKPLPRHQLAILTGVDALILLAVTMIGFASHQHSLAGGRWLTTFLPLALAWLLTSPWFGLYSPGIVDRPGQFWRALWAAAIAAPLAVFFRGVWLQTSVDPIFTAVMMATTALGLGLWRLIWGLLASGKKTSHG